MNENLNLVELLKDVPKGTKFYCSNFGYVKFVRIDYSSDYPIRLYKDDGRTPSLTIDGKWWDCYPDAECVLFPSKTQRDWSVWVKEQEEAKKQLLPIGTPVMVKDGFAYQLRYYHEYNKCFLDGRMSKSGLSSVPWNVIIPFDKFDPNNIEESLKHNIVKK